MVDGVARMLERIRWTREDAAAFLGTYVSDPKAHVLFDPPARPVGRRTFAQRVARTGIRLAPTTLLLVRKNACFINGEALGVPASARRAVARLADARFLIPGAPLPGPAADLLYTWYRAGYALIGGHHE
jgi:50S ribosomal protein L16 3-hydroxylase